MKLKFCKSRIVGANLKVETMKLMEKRIAIESEMNAIIERLCQPGGPGLTGNLVATHRPLMNLFDKAPAVDKEAFVAPTASIVGDVQVGRGSSIWYGCVLRGEVNSITVGSGTNIQDNSLVHVAKSNLSGKVLPTVIGDSVTIGHSVVLHGYTDEDEAFIGMGATLLDAVYVEKHAMVAAGALVRQNTRIPCGEVRGPLSFETDVWAFGCNMMEMFSGTQP